ncbi:helix-turn-helix transcriptional regulator [Deinococcus peraridilitoris]|uniref:Putative transcriptional regulator n=1 Tax=Deinococcus peraridilitoris (strain DSM 19664 / LMG 22246 / CIP 109416 / KR-200) TaxID=937777 RepID=K9ZW06_DEIPD|nr:helix-turn-helix domain-containing protein [Deinococcus peraridilitoris]AFZ65818.1 putative transcriptional regulator [Deinococcus peraridilitoris DSM 19664]
MTRAAPLPQQGDRTKTRVLTLLKGQECSTAGHVAQALQISVPAARKHLLDLEEAGLIESTTHKPGGRGRPQLVYRLTESGEARFPKSYATLCVDVLAHVESLFGSGAVLKVMDARRAQFAERLAQQMHGNTAERVEQLVAFLNGAGYDARAYQERGVWYLEQGNCPGLEVAKKYDQLCHSELELYRELLAVPVRRETRIACGAPSCRYRIG